MPTNTSATNNKNASIQAASPATNYGDTFPGPHTLQLQGDSSNLWHSMIDFTLPANPGGTVTAVSLNMTVNPSSFGGNTAINIGAYQCLRNWTQAGSTWNKYDGSNSWATAGGTGAGDINSSVISSVTPAASGLLTWPLMGAGATNPLTLTWGSDVNLLLKFVNETTNPNTTFLSFLSGAATSNKPFLLVTYVNAFGLTCQVGVFTLTGEPTILNRAWQMILGFGRFALSGFKAILKKLSTIMLDTKHTGGLTEDTRTSPATLTQDTKTTSTFTQDLREP